MAKHYMRHPDNILSATRCLTLEQRGIYNDFIDLYIARDGDLPDDDQKRARDTAIDPRRYRRLKRDLLDAGKIEIRAGMIIPTGAAETLAIILSKSGSARKSANARWEKRDIDPLEKADLGDTYGLHRPDLGDSESLATYLTHGKTTKPDMQTHKKRICESESEKKKEEEGADAPRQYAFEGKVICLNSTDLETWRTRFKNIPNIEAELTSYDAFLSDQPEEERKRWFQRTPAWLANKDAKYAQAEPPQYGGL